MWRVGTKVSLNVYEDDRPMFQCHTSEDAARAVGLLNLGDARSSEDGLPVPTPTYYESLLVGGSGLTGKVPDSRIAGVNATAPYSTLQPGPFQFTADPISFPYN